MSTDFLSFNFPEISDELSECAMQLRTNIVDLLQDGGSEPDYIAFRAQLMGEPSAKKLLPDFVRHSSDAASLRIELSNVARGDGSWAKRRKHISESFKPLLNYLEDGGAAADAIITGGLTHYNAPAVDAIWRKALERRAEDPDGAVTAASTLLEEVCKHIIEDSGIELNAKWGLSKLYAEAAKVLNLSPSQHQAEIFKTILGNCQSIVQNLGALRNNGGDAHAGGRARVALKSRHAALTVNLAGAMALFLIETFEAKGSPAPAK
ncbi:MAG: abortive infection family protein [Rhodobacteraceae bacterium]|nr:abortive infection family protein [Paracoccaceae bacterium]